MILAGDVCYDQGMSNTVMNWLQQQANKNVQVLVGDPGRPYLLTSMNANHVGERSLKKLESYLMPTDLIENAASGFPETSVYEIVSGMNHGNGKV